MDKNNKTIIKVAVDFEFESDKEYDINKLSIAFSDDGIYLLDSDNEIIEDAELIGWETIEIWR